MHLKKDSDERSSAVTATADLTIRLVHIPPDTALETFAENQLRRHVGQGEPAISSRYLNKRQVRTFGWTNGVDDIETMFIGIASATSLALRIDISIGGVSFPRGRDERLTFLRSASTIVESLKWTDAESPLGA